MEFIRILKSYHQGHRIRHDISGVYLLTHWQYIHTVQSVSENKNIL